MLALHWFRAVQGRNGPLKGRARRPQAAEGAQAGLLHEEDAGEMTQNDRFRSLEASLQQVLAELAEIKARLHPSIFPPLEDDTGEPIEVETSRGT